MRLFEKAKRYGVWNPSDIDFSQDRADWLRLTEIEREVLLHLTSLFQGGEEAVTLDLLPLLMAIAREGRIEEELFLTTFLWEEAKHTDFFRRFLDEVTHVDADLSRFQGAHYKVIFDEALPQALGALLADPSPAAQVRASVTYNMIVEGVLAETGYHGYHQMLERNGLMPGNLKGITHLKQDESRHIAFGIYLISRLIAEDERLWDMAEMTMNSLILPALGVIEEIFSRYDPVPFGLNKDDFIDYATSQFQKRYMRVMQARGASMEAVQAIAQAAIDSEDA
jgi:ribonucleoside-diphosphate reductase beta chain